MQGKSYFLKENQYFLQNAKFQSLAHSSENSSEKKK